MSKVVTIPTYQSPFVVMVNGVKYVFPAGSVQEVPDEVAVVIEANGRKKPEEPVDAPFDCCEGGGPGGGTQSDWNQTDSSAADFIKNKPFGDMPAVLVEKQTVTFEDGMAIALSNDTPNAGTAATLHLNETTYSGTVKNSDFGVCMGNLAALGMDDTGEPFFVIWDGSMAMIVDMTGVFTECSVKIDGMKSNKLSDAYYTSQTILYNPGSDDYLYKDNMYVEKITRGELLNTISNKPIQIIIGIDRLFVSAIGLASNDYGVAIVVLPDGSRRDFFTAEYVPES